MAAATKYGQSHDDDHTTCINRRCSVIVIERIILLSCLALLAWMTVSMVTGDHTPHIPEFSLVSASTTVRNISESNHRVTMDVNVSFTVRNPNKAAMVYQDIRALAFQYGHEVPGGGGLSNIDAVDFEQLGTRRSTEWFRIRNTTASIDAWVDSGDVNPTFGKSGKSLALHFELRGDAVYKDERNWSEERIPIQVVCDEVDLLFSSNATRAVAFETTAGCRVYGLWGRVRENLRITIQILLALVPVTTFFVVLYVISKIYGHNSVRDCVLSV